MGCVWQLVIKENDYDDDDDDLRAAVTISSSLVNIHTKPRYIFECDGLGIVISNTLVARMIMIEEPWLYVTGASMNL